MEEAYKSRQQPFEVGQDEIQGPSILAQESIIKYE